MMSWAAKPKISRCTRMLRPLILIVAVVSWVIVAFCGISALFVI
jgi:hypothetical protein